MSGPKPFLKIRFHAAEISGLFLFSVFFCILTLSFGCGPKQEKAKPEKVVNVRIASVEKKSIRPFLESVGTLKADEEATVSSELDGILKVINTDEGRPVSRGQIMALLNDIDFRLNLETAKAGLNQAQANLVNIREEYRRKETLFKEDLVTQQQFDDVSTRLAVAGQELDRAKTTLALANEKLGKTVIRSPLQGIVKEKKASAGDFVKAGSALLAIIRIDPLKLSFTVPEKELGALKIGQDVLFSVDAFPDKEFKGKLNVIFPYLDERSRTLQVEALVANSALQLKPGLFARVKLYTSAPREAVVIPITALLYDETRIKVFLLDQDRAREQLIKIGAKYGEMVEVLEGLQGGEPLIVVGQNNLVQGVKINGVH
ncbi:MAG: efflux RND transporter periplasmic adaptor subunit [Desulfobacteraceae bacterium]|nr:MAG: efflux RND transporter periplasmic adaptor subunit [Desulfobacteraceae bacterium]